MSAALALTGIAGTLLSGAGESAALKSEAKSLEYQAKAERLRGKQISAARRDDLNDTLATIDAIRASRGVSLDSPSAVAYRRHVVKTSQTNENVEVLSSKFRETDIKTQAAAKRRAAPFTLLAGISRSANLASGFLDKTGAFKKKSGGSSGGSGLNSRISLGGPDTPFI